METNKVAVSIIIPIYNTETFLAEAIESILAQTFTELEIILVNDGSLDNSKEICKKYSRENSKIVYLEQENQGVSIARNNGLSVAKGDYIYFMDSDDSIAEEYIENAYQLLKSKQADIAIIGTHFCNKFPNTCAFPTWAIMISNAFLKQLPDVRFPERIQPCEDGLFSHMLFTQSPKVVLYPEGVYHYRIHKDQNHTKINENTQNTINQIPKWFKILEDHYLKYNLFKSHALHLAMFMQHEPFGLRYLQMPLNTAQKSFLFNLIKEFTNKNVLVYLKENEKRKLNPLFVEFLKSKNHRRFDFYYLVYQQKNKLKLFLTKLIPIKSSRRKIRKKLKDGPTL